MRAVACRVAVEAMESLCVEEGLEMRCTFWSSSLDVRLQNLSVE